MKIGYFTLTDNPPLYEETQQNPQQMIRSLVEEAVYAEELGFHSVWVPEHHFGLFGVLPSPSMLLAHVAARTKRIELAPATVLLPVNHPIRMAEEYALLDVLSNGRTIFSAGRGYDEREYRVFGIDYNLSQEIFFEQLDIIKEAWTKRAVSYEGKHFQIPEIEVVPRPVQSPHPPVYVASFSRPSLEKAASLGFNVIFAPFAAAMVFGNVQEAAAQFRRTAEENGFQDTKVKCSYFIQVSKNKWEVESMARRMLKYFRGILPAFPQDPEKTPPSIRYFLDIVQRLSNMKTEDLSERSIINGDAEHCIRVLKDVEAAGIDEVILYFNVGGLPHKDTMLQMERFAQEVLPYIK
ncbi:LLM class flavin-dependent oxidoreductase [Kyrpidia tusciae]|uniref:Luciferase-like, subgroup n=1 Tax=Kyrpidia tusciae (strain DSM 2912 / NBRC 15312 / T2) TaxID=562970 RepID=D5WS42_KYRT2|nr:LLM class flavin-dependent oxidoreductase [Kyrpidia tusciae]ADG06994.1 Luciferase-like, subgroup [Kyrpidia tusciae DSM 2912]